MKKTMQVSPTFSDLDHWLRDLEETAVGMAGLAPEPEVTSLRNEARLRCAVLRNILREHFSGKGVPSYIVVVEVESES